MKSSFAQLALCIHRCPKFGFLGSVTNDASHITSHAPIVIDPNYDYLPNVSSVDIKYDVYQGLADKKTKIGEKVCRFVELPTQKAVISRILLKLPLQRKLTRKRIEYRVPAAPL
jgi:hypothetical protein